MNPRTPQTDLAILVPAYRKEFLREALRSIIAQTDQRSCLYVFDDASPDDLRVIYDAEVKGGSSRHFFGLMKTWVAIPSHSIGTDALSKLGKKNGFGSFRTTT